MKEKMYWIWLSKLEIKNKIKLELLDKFGNVEKLYRANIDDLIYFGFSDSVINKVTDLKIRENLNEEFKYMKQNKIDIINYKEHKYPEKLLDIYDFPICLYCIGNVNLLKQNNIAIIGARKASGNGKIIARNFAKQIADKNVNIVSGLALGIDKFSHLGALDSKGGKTIAVLGTGINKEVLYPMENLKVYERIVENGGLIISEYPINSKPVAYHFPERNRIISAVSEKLIVIEASKKSGSLITVDFALEQGKDIFVVPGSILDPIYEGSNNLIKQGAFVITSVDDLY